MKEGQELRHSFFSLVEALDISPTVALETTDMATAQTLAGIGVGAAIVPGGLAVADTPAVEPKYFSLRAYLDDWDVVLAYSGDAICPRRTKPSSVSFATSFIEYRKRRCLHETAPFCIPKGLLFCEVTSQEAIEYTAVTSFSSFAIS